MKKTLRPFLGIILIIAIGIGLLAFQRQYIQKHLPLITNELAVAETEGLKIIEGIGVPPGSTPYEEGSKTFPSESRNSMWRGAKIRVKWRREWQSPGNHESVEQWFRDRLEGLGWQPFLIGVPSTVEKSFWKDKWLLTLQRGADFSTDRDPYVRYTLVLEWDYWHNLGR